MSDTVIETTGPSPAKMKALAEVLGKIERDYGKGAIIDMSGPQAAIPAISTGALPLDIALGIGGIPRGRLIELFGPESSGKTTLVYHCIASVQQAGGIAAFIDTEHSMDARYAAHVGVNIEDLLVSQPDYGEQALQIAQVLVESGAVDLIAIDSVAALTPKAEIDGQIGDQSMGLLARMMSQACRVLAPKCNQNDTTILFTNQIREKIGVMFGSNETQPGGRALKFYASQRLDIRRIETIKDGTEAVGNRVRVKVVKNKVAPPFKQAEFVIAFGVGVDREATLIEMHTADPALTGITKAGAFLTFTMTGEKSQGVAKGKAYLKEHPEVADALEAEIRKLYLEEGHDVTDTVSDLPPEGDPEATSTAAEPKSAAAAEPAAAEPESAEPAAA
jgi:recombination protein RecA